MQRKGFGKLKAIAPLVLLLFVFGFSDCQQQPKTTVPGAAPSPTVQTAPAGPMPPPPASDWRTAIASVAQAAIPAVVHIEVTEREEIANPFMPFEGNPFFQFFFNAPHMPRKFKRELRGLGSGMIMDAEGHILTNYHVVGGASKIDVTLADGENYPAKVIGTDAKTDLAVIQIQAKEKLPHVVFGDSDNLGVGDWVVAIGHPRGLDQTVTQGIISAKHRTGISDPSSYQDFLQTDAAINPGNSGGPLLNLNGEVIGVNAAIMSESGGFEGLGFAIPSDMALPIARTLIAKGKVERGWLGVSIQDLTADVAKSIGLNEPKGALIADVVKGGPGAAAGLKRGDVVLSYRDKPIANASGLRIAVANTAIGQEANMSVWRDKKKEDFQVRIGSMEEAVKLLSVSVKERLGATVRPISPKEDEKYGIEPGDGIAIASVDPKGVLGQAGMEAQDLILQVNGETVRGVDGFVNSITALPDKQPLVILALDHRTGQSGYVQLKVN
jgi:serine protease Do